MKIAVYTIALNEEQFVERWYNSAKDADYLLIADTGSDDNTVELAQRLGIEVVSICVKPWRFDDARNVSLAHIPSFIDYCIALDMDEVLVDGWREELEKVNPEVTRPRYKYTWSWKEDGTEGLTYGGDKIHKRQGYRWKHPVHEVITADRLEEVQGWVGLEIHHHPDHTKSRSQYMDLLAQSVEEDPYDDRNAYYYARELFYHGRYDEASMEFTRHLSLPKSVWPPERAASWRYLAKIYGGETRRGFLEEAIETDPNRREALVEMSQYHYEQKNWKECFEFAKRALDIKEKPLDYLCEEFAWGYLPYDLAALSSYYLGDKKEALKYGKKALELEPDNERLASNLAWYKSK